MVDPRRAGVVVLHEAAPFHRQEAYSVGKSLLETSDQTYWNPATEFQYGKTGIGVIWFRSQR